MWNGESRPVGEICPHHGHRQDSGVDHSLPQGKRKDPQQRGHQQGEKGVAHEDAFLRQAAAHGHARADIEHRRNSDQDPQPQAHEPDVMLPQGPEPEQQEAPAEAEAEPEELGEQPGCQEKVVNRDPQRRSRGQGKSQNPDPPEHVLGPDLAEVPRMGPAGQEVDQVGPLEPADKRLSRRGCRRRGVGRIGHGGPPEEDAFKPTRRRGFLEVRRLAGSVATDPLAQ